MAEKKNGTMTLYEQVAKQILQQIEDGVYRKGDMLPGERELIARTGVSRITVREALKQLAEMGVIETRKGKGSFVLVNPESLHNDRQKAGEDFYRTSFIESSKARLLIEPEIAGSAAEMATEEDIRELEATLKKRRRGAVNEDQFDDFHLALAKAAHNSLILEIMEGLLEKEARLLSEFAGTLVVPEKQKSVSAELQHQHAKIYEAVKEHNKEFACFYMKEHMQYLIRSYEEFFTWFL